MFASTNCPRVEIGNSAILAGMRVHCNRPLAGLSIGGDADLSLEIRFETAMSDDFPAPPGAHPLPESTGLRGWIGPDGRHAMIVEPRSGEFDIACSIRRVLPFASALQGGIVLHGAAVVFGPGVHVFIGASGAGKSTLAAEMAISGMPLLADDLTPCRWLDGGMVVPLPAGLIPGAQNARLSGIHFLSRSRAVDCASFVSLTPAQCVAQLLWNGFGELAVPEIWATQFRMYSRIAQCVPSFALTVPDNQCRVAATATEVRTAIEAPNLPGSA